MADSTGSGTGPVTPAGTSTAPAREQWGSRTGFILAAVGSAVGLGNMWRFPYATAEGGGAAFVLLYILFTFLVGLPVLLAEMGIGRSTRLSPIGALRAKGGRGWSVVGWVFVLAGLIILSFYSVIAGWVIRYMLQGAVAGFSGDSAAYFEQVTSGVEPVIYHLVFMVLTITIVMGGIEKGIERASLIMMPLLFLVVIGLAVWAFTLPGSGAGYEYYLTPSFEELMSLDTLAAAAGQAFFSLSLGMGAIITFSSYLGRKENLPGSGVTIALSDFSVAFIAGLMVFPIIFALGLQQTVSGSAVGTLFISLPDGFVAMGGVGRWIGTLFFVVLFVGALTSAISLLEVVTSSLIDEMKIPRRRAAITAGGVITALGILPAMDIDVLGAMDAIASGVLLLLGGLALAILVGWKTPQPAADIREGMPLGAQRWLPLWRGLLRFLVPVMLILVLSQTIPDGIAAVQAAFGDAR